MRLAIVASHPVQYYAPLYRTLAGLVDLHVFYAHRTTGEQQARAGFGVAFEWDVDLTSGFESSFLTNVSAAPSTGRFRGCDTPGVGEALRAGGFDAVLVMGWHLKTFWQATWAAKRADLPVMVRGDSQLGSPRSPLKRLAKEVLYPPALRVFDVALYVGARNRAYFEHYRYPADRLVFSPHCVDTQWFAERGTPAAGRALRAELGIASDAKVVLFAGKLTGFKRPLDVVEACGRLQRGGLPTTLMIAGSGDLEGSIRAGAETLGLDLRMLGFRNQTEMPAAYAAADVLALPSDGRETWGLVANEALACGTPIVVSDAVGSAPDLAAGTGAGRVFPLGEVKALAESLEAILRKPPSAEAMLATSDAYSLRSAALGISAACRMVAKGPGRERWPVQRRPG